MKEIELTKGYKAMVDDEDYEWLSSIKWCVIITFQGKKYAHNTKHGYMHRLILGLTDAKTQCDHIDCDGINNTRANLRPCTPAQNAANTRYRNDRGTKTRGVGINRHGTRYVAHIKYDGNKRKHLGSYSTQQEAAQAYNEAALIHHGEFAVLNKI